jgi:hypothetical protein
MRSSREAAASLAWGSWPTCFCSPSWDSVGGLGVGVVWWFVRVENRSPNNQTKRPLPSSLSETEQTRAARHNGKSKLMYPRMVGSWRHELDRRLLLVAHVLELVVEPAARGPPWSPLAPRRMHLLGRGQKGTARCIRVQTHTHTRTYAHTHAHKRVGAQATVCGACEKGPSLPAE